LIISISASQVARISGVSNQHQLISLFFILKQNPLVIFNLEKLDGYHTRIINKKEKIKYEKN
jgi:hypothetical protein